MRTHLLALLLASAIGAPIAFTSTAHADTFQFTYNGVFQPFPPYTSP